MSQMPVGIDANPNAVDWSGVTNKPNTTLVINGDATGSCVFTELADATMTLEIVDDSHRHSNTSVSDLDWAKVSNKISATTATAGIVT
jgi:hypothetical protein